MNNFYKIEEICKVKGGKRIPAGETLQNEKNDHPYIRIVDMYQGKYIEHKNMLYVRDKYLNKIKNYTVKKGDVILAIVGNTLGIVSMIGDSLDGANLTENCCKFDKLDESLVTKQFLYYSLLSDFNQNQISRFKVGSSQPKLPMYNINQLIVPKKTIIEQNKITSFLESIDQMIINNNMIIEEYSSCLEELFDNIFINFSIPGKNIELKYCEELKMNIPINWRTSNVAELLSVVTGKEDANFSTPDGKYPFFTCSMDNYWCDEFAFDGSAILVAGNGELNVKYYEGKFNAYQRTYVLIPNERKYAGLIYLNVKKRIDSLKKGSNGSIVKFITKKDVENIGILIPDDEKLLEPINQLMHCIQMKNKEIDRLTKFKNFILPLLMNGQIKIENIVD